MTLLFETCEMDGRPVLPIFGKAAEPDGPRTIEECKALVLADAGPSFAVNVREFHAGQRAVRQAAEAQPGDLLKFHFPCGATHPFEATRLKKPLGLEALITVLAGGRRRVKVAGCYPPGGFTVGPETWERIYSPYVVA